MKKEKPPIVPFSKLLTVSEVAEILGVSPVTIRSWDKSGKLKTLRTPGN
jgi:putative resolvase